MPPLIISLLIDTRCPWKPLTMRLKARVFILLIIFFIFFVSFKIMEPELQAHPGGREVRQDSDYDSDWGGNSDVENANEVDRATRVAHLKKRYDVPWNANHSLDLWDTAANWLNYRHVTPDVAPELGAILQKLTTAKITGAYLGYRGTQLKMTLFLDGGQRVAFKPKWYDRDHVISGKPYDGADRHNGEITAFHINRILGFGRSPIVVGRVIDMEKEIRPVADPKLTDTFFKKDGNSCFYGKCYYCKGPSTGVCGSGDLLEGAILLWLPKEWQFKQTRSPWGRTYREGVTAQWESAGNFCQKVLHTPPYDQGPRLLDMIDAAVFDYLIGNADAHHYDTFSGYEDSVVVLLDRAKSFGNPYMDEETILAPLYHCCRLRRSTWERLKYVKDGVLTEVLRQVLSRDSIAPLLAEPHYQALDRRLDHILTTIDTCLSSEGSRRVLLTDAYSIIDSDVS